MTPPFLHIDSVTKRFGLASAGVPPVLDNIHLTLAKGEFVSLLGPSGCGKSTLLRLVSGLDTPDAGRVTLGGLAPEAARALSAFIFQDACLLPWLSAEENAALPLSLGRRTQADARETARRMLDLVGLGDARHRLPSELSGGMKMRVSIARALTLRPQLLLLDEPFGALDELTRDRLHQDILALRDRDRWAALFVTHSPAEAVYLSHRIIVLAAQPGRIWRDIPVDLPTLRSPALRRTPEFHRALDAVDQAVREASGQGPLD
jgi:NitT/TauT family transport system ATP-binding protein